MESISAFQQALSNIEKLQKVNNDGLKYKSLKLTVLFNMGYWHEHAHEYSQANIIYKQICSSHPDYIDAFLRLAFLARKRGDISRALFWIDEASKSKARAPVNQHCLKGKILFDIGQINESANEFKYVLERIVPDDSYSFLGLANICFKNALGIKDGGGGEQDRMLVKAYNKYLEILYHDQTNCYACIGLANILAFFNKTEDALEIYKLMSHSNPNLYQPLINQAHLSIGLKNYELSINLYQKVLEKFKPNDLRIEMYLAKAYYRKGDFEASKTLTMQLLARYPNHIGLRFNLALCLYQQADRIFN